MTRIFQSLFVLSCLFMVESQTDQILPPQNVTLKWISDFKAQLSWAPPQHSVENCAYAVWYKDPEGRDNQNTVYPDVSSWSGDIVLGGGFMSLSVETVCDDTSSEKVLYDIAYPELLSELQCSKNSSKQAHCSWRPTNNDQELSFFYVLLDESGEKFVPKPLQPCSSYTYTGHVRTGCDLPINDHHAIHILFNGTLNNTLVRNTYRKELEVKPPPLNWTVFKDGDRFNISWTPPDFGSQDTWMYTINYTECNKSQERNITTGKTTVLQLVSHCRYCMAIKASNKYDRHLRPSTPWSEEKCFDADADAGSNTLVYAAIFIPLMFAGLAALAFVCCRKNKDNIFPKVPEPRDLLSDISNNNIKSTVCNLYVPAEEEDNCKITLVIDPQDNKQQNFCLT